MEIEASGDSLDNMPLRVRLSFGSKDKVNGDKKGSSKKEEVNSDEEPDSSEDNGLPDLPEGTVVVQPEPVPEKLIRFRGPEFKSASKKGNNGGGNAAVPTQELDNLFCTACARQVNPWKTGMVKKHKDLRVLICRKCYNFLGSGEIAQDEDGMDEQCRWCGEGGRLTICDKCPRAFCKACVMRNFGRAAFTAVTESENWECYICDPEPLGELRKQCRTVFSAIDAANNKKSSKSSQQPSPAPAGKKSSASAASVEKSSSSSKPQSEFADDPASVLTNIFSSLDCDEDNIVPMARTLLEATTTLRVTLLNICEAVGITQEKKHAEDKVPSFLSFSKDTSLKRKKQLCAGALKKVLTTYSSSVGQIIRREKSRKQPSHSQSDDSSSKSVSHCNGDVGTSSSRSAGSKRFAHSSPCSSKSSSTSASSSNKLSASKSASSTSESARKEESKSTDEKKSKKEDETVSKDNADGKKSRKDDESGKKDKVDDKNSKKGDDRDKRDKADEKKSKKKDDDASGKEESRESGKRDSGKRGAGVEEEKKKKGDKKGEDKEEMSRSSKAGNKSHAARAIVIDSEDEVMQIECDEIESESDTEMPRKPSKDKAVEEDTEETTDKQTEPGAGDSAKSSDKKTSKGKQSAKPISKPSSEVSSRQDSQESGLPDSMDLSQQEENLLAKFELIQELAEEFCKESEAEKNTDKNSEDQDHDSDSESLPEVSFGISPMNDVGQIETEEQDMETSATKSKGANDNANDFSDISDVESEPEDKGKGKAKKEASKKEAATPEKKSKKTREEADSSGDNKKKIKSTKKSTKSTPQKKARDSVSEKADDVDSQDLPSSDLILSSDEGERRGKRKRRLKKKKKNGSSANANGKQDSSDESDMEKDSDSKTKRRVKMTPKKESQKKTKGSEEEEDDESTDKKKRKSKSRNKNSDKSDEEDEKSEKEKKSKSKSKAKSKNSEENGADEKKKQKKEKSKKDLNSSEEDELLEKEIDNLLAGVGKRKKKKKTEDENEEDENQDSAAEDGEVSEKQGRNKGQAVKKERKGKKEEKDSSDSSDEENGDEDEEDDIDDDSGEEMKSKNKEKKKNNADLENETAKAALKDKLEDEDDDDDDDDDDDENDEEDPSSESDDEAVSKKRKSKKSSKEKSDDKNSDDKDGEDGEEDDSDFEDDEKRKRFRSRLLDAKISDSDSDIEVKKKKGKKRKRDSDDESFSGGKSDNDDDDDDDEGDSVADSDEVADDKDASDSSASGKKKKKKKGKGKGKGKDKGKKRRRIKKMSSSEAEAEEGGEDGEDPSSRKKIRKIKSDKKLGDTTKAAARAEEERRQRVKDKQKKFNGVVQKDAGDGQAPITTKLVLEQDEDGEPIIAMNSKLVCKLKPHQVEAVQFMWDCLFESLERSKKEEKSAGCILAHCMGLGKTLSVVSFIHTMMTHKKLTKVKTCLVVSPLNTVLNWMNEFEIWLDEDDQLTVYEMASVKQNGARADTLDEWHKNGGILIIGYEMLRNLSQGSRVRNKKQKACFQRTLIDPGPDIVVCDEGHIMKNAASALSKAMSKIKTRRRIVLTGTPLQNNLIEYHCMVDFVKENLLGTKKEFANRFVNPIMNGQHSDSTGRDVRVMKNRAHVLHELLAGCVQRRDYSALTKFLPPKQEYVISVRLTDVQIKIYEEYLRRNGQVDGQITTRGAQLFKDYQNLMKIWTHPWVLKLAEIRDELKMKYDDEDSFIDEEYSDEEKSFGSDSSSSSSESEAPKPVSEEEESAGEGTSAGRRSRRLRNKDRAARDDKDEVVKEWKTRSRGGDDDDMDVESADMPPQAVSNEWWAEYVKEEDKNKMELGSKLVLLFDILRMSEEIGDKVLIFSQSLLSLNIIEYFLEQVDTKFTEETQDKADEELKEEFGRRWTKGDDYFRLDGSTSAQMRQHWATIFNNPENHRARLFLISTRAGGLGINLVGANRVIIFDASWNPSHDVQSIFRVYRFGQTKPCYIYRFMAQGTMEEKIYDRQVNKLSLSQRVVDEHQVERHFTAADLSELYAFKPFRLGIDKEKETPMLPKDVLLAEIMSGDHQDLFVSLHEHDSLLENLVEQELTEEEKKAAWDEYENEKKGLRMNVSNMGQGGAGLGNYLSQEFLLQTARNLRMQHPDMPQEVLQMHLQRIIMMQVRQKQEEQRRLEMMERQQASRFMQMQQRYAQLQQQYMQQMGAGGHGAAAAAAAGMYGMMPPGGAGQRFSPSLYAHMAQPGLSAFHGGSSAAAAMSRDAGTSKDGDGVPETEVIDLDESTD